MRYKGLRFKSTVEARWAVLFDLLALEWLYESHIFMLECGKGYLPDFYLPKWGLFLEIKDDLVKGDFLFFKMSCAVKEFEDTFYLFNGNAGCRGLKLTAETTPEECNRTKGGYCVMSMGLIHIGYRRPNPDLEYRELVKIARTHEFGV